MSALTSSNVRLSSNPLDRSFFGFKKRSHDDDTAMVKDCSKNHFVNGVTFCILKSLLDMCLDLF